MIFALVAATALATGGATPPPAEPLPPFTFRSVTTAPLSSIDPKTLFTRCSKGTARTYCILPSDKIAGIGTLEPISVAYNLDGTMSSLSVKVHSGFDSILRTALTEKYGKPCKEGTEEVQNSFGARLTRQFAQWCFADGQALFESPSRRATEASFWFISNNQRETPPKVDF